MKKIKILTIILVIILITMISFFGIYTQVQNRMENQVKDYSYAMDIEGARTIKLKVNTETETIIKDSEGKEVEDTEETENLTDEQLQEKGYTKEEIPYNSEEAKNLENYKKSKSIIEKRLNKMGVNNYSIQLDENTGDILLQIAENEQTDSIVSNINITGKFEIADSETEETLITNNDLKNVNVMYSQSSAGTTVCLSMEFNKEGAKKLEEISNTYKKAEEETADEEADEETADEETDETTDETNEEELVDATQEEKKIAIKIDDTIMATTNFEEPIQNGILRLSIGEPSTEEEELVDNINRATNTATALDDGALPLKYDLDENILIYSEITNEQIQTIKYIVLGILAIAMIILIFRYKISGILGVISYIGFLATLLLSVRIFNVVLAIEGMVGLAIIALLNYMLTNKLLKENPMKNYKNFFIKMIPLIILAVAFSFASWESISSFGMVMFWGYAVMALYNILITINLLKIKAGKEK